VLPTVSHDRLYTVWPANNLPVTHIAGTTAGGPRNSIQIIAEAKGTFNVVHKAALIPTVTKIKEGNTVYDPTIAPRNAPTIITGMKSPPLPPVPEIREVAIIIKITAPNT